MEFAMVRGVFRKHMSTYLLNVERSELFVHNGPDGMFAVYWGATPNARHGGSYFDVNIQGDTFYLLYIEIAKRFRGRGYGAALYGLLEKIAAELGCKRLEQTPSGWTVRGETRASYLQRRGYTLENNVAFKIFKQPVNV